MKILSEEESIDLKGEKTQNYSAYSLLSDWVKSLYLWNGTNGLVLILTEVSNWERKKETLQQNGYGKILMNLLFNPRLLSFCTLFRMPWFSVLD